MSARFKGLWIGILALAAVACQTPSKTIHIPSSTQGTLKEADQYFDQGQYRTAQMKYWGYVHAPYPDKKFEAYARHRLALCHFFLGDYSDAYENLSILLQENPNYEFKKDVQEVMAQCEAKIQVEKEKVASQWKDLQQKILQYEQFTAQNPQNAQYHFELGNLYWSAARFTSAVSEYEKAAKLEPQILQKDQVKNRIRITDSGQYVVRDPLLDLGKNESVQVVDAHLERVQRSNWLGQVEVLRLSGFVENQGIKDVRNVRIEATIYDFFDKIQDTKTVPIGNLPAGQRSAFSVIMDQFSGLAVDIRKFTTKVMFD